MSSAIFDPPAEVSGTELLSVIGISNGLKIILYGLRLRRVRPRAGGAAMNQGKNARPPAHPPDSARLRYFEERQSELVHTIREFVEIESPSDNKLAADRMGALLAAKFEARGGR